jgi:hypothetical protein
MTGQSVTGSTELTALQIDQDADLLPVIDVSASGVAKNKKAFLAALFAAFLGPMEPGGRLTLTSNTPVMIADAVAQSSVYYAPYKHSRIPIYTGLWWLNRAFSQLTMALDTTNQLASKVYDLFVFNNAGTIAIGAGPAWARASTVTITIATPGVISWTAHGLNEGDPVVFTTTGALPTGLTAGTTYYVSASPATDSFSVSTSVANAAAGTKVATSGSQSGVHTATNGTRTRGTGAGTTELELKDGVWTNKNTITLTNGAGAGTAGIVANTATYVGSIYCTANGQTGMALQPAAASGGSNNVLGVYNAYNRVRMAARCGESTTNWSNASTTWKGKNANVGNRISYLDGLAQSAVIGRTGIMVASAGGIGGTIGMNRNSTTGNPAACNQVYGGANVPQFVADQWLPSLGFNYVQAMEASVAGTINFYGIQAGPPVMNHGHFSVDLDL